MKESLTIFCLPLSGFGHVNACVGICTALKRRGHKIVFGVEKSWRGKLKERGFEEEVYEQQQTNNEEESGAQHSKFFAELSPILRKSFKEHLTFNQLGFMKIIEWMKYSDQQIQEIIEKVKPDVMILDHYISYPSMVKSKITTVLIHSANPLVALQDVSLPPTGFGLPLDDKTNWEMYRQMRDESTQKLYNYLNEWFIEQGLPSLPPLKLQYESPLNIQLYPKVLFDGYAKLINLSQNWVLLEHTITSPVEPFSLPADFSEKPGKLIYLSMGTMGSSDVQLMIRLTKILSKSKHKFVVAKGHNHKEYDLYENQWGEAFVNQLQILQLCDLFITHGGNNSLTEAFYFGKPMIICPLFGDQYNNAQRVSELNLGVRLNPFTVEEDELLSTIDVILSDTVLHNKLQIIKNEMQNSNSMDYVTKRIELVAGITKT